MIHGDKDVEELQNTSPVEQIKSSVDNLKIRLLAVIILIVLGVLFKHYVIR